MVSFTIGLATNICVYAILDSPSGLLRSSILIGKLLKHYMQITATHVLTINRETYLHTCMISHTLYWVGDHTHRGGGKRARRLIATRIHTLGMQVMNRLLAND